MEELNLIRSMLVHTMQAHYRRFWKIDMAEEAYDEALEGVKTSENEKKQLG